MTSQLTRISVGALSLFFVCMIAGATMLKSKANPTPHNAAKTTEVAEQTPESNNKFDPVELTWNQSSKPGNISYYGGQFIEEKPQWHADTPDTSRLFQENLRKTQ